MEKSGNQVDNNAVGKLIEDLQSHDEKARRYAAEDLGYEKYRQGIPSLVKGLTDPSIAVSEACADALINIGGEDIAEQIAPYLASENVRLRNHASEIMNLLGEPAVPVLIEQLKSSNHDVRMFAVDNLVNISSKKSVNALIDILDDENINVAAAAAIGLGKVGNQEHLAILMKYLDSDIWMKCSVLRGMGFLGNPEAINAILPMTRDEDLMVKISAIQALSKLADNTILPELLNLLKEESLELFGIETLNVIHEIIIAYPNNEYAKLFDEELLNVMTCLAQIGDIQNKIKTIKILGYSKSEAIVPLLVKLLSNDDIDIRKSVVESIVQIDPQDLSPLKKFLEDEDSPFEQKCTALECIGRSSSNDRYTIIKSFLDSPDDTLPRITLDAIHTGFKPVPVTEIIRLLNSQISDIRISAAAAMGRLRNKEFINALIEKLNDEESEVQEAVDDALIQIGEKHEIPILAPYLNSFSKSERKIAFQYFGIHHPESLSQKFIEGLDDPSVDIRVISLKVIANLKIATLELIKKGIRDPVDTVQVQAVRTLLSISDKEGILPFIQEILSGQTSERIKVELIQVLAGLENVNTVNSIIPLLHDSSSWVQIEAVEVLKTLGDSSVVNSLKKLRISNNNDLLEVVEDAIEQLE